MSDLHQMNTRVNTNRDDRSAGAKLAAERKARGITQEALATRMGVSTARISAIESGQNRLRDETVFRYMTCLDLVSHDQADMGDVNVRLTIDQIQWLAIYTELTEEERAEAKRLMLNTFAGRLNDRLHEESVRKSE